MMKPTARRTKATYVQTRMENADKEVLQRWAEHRGITLSALLRTTLKNLADIARSRLPPQ